MTDPLENVTIEVIKNCVCKEFYILSFSGAVL